MARRDYYEVLGVRRDAEQSELQRAYRRLARELHPDLNKDPAASDRFKEVSEAYDVLSDPEQRRRYDAFGDDFRRVPEGADTAAWTGRHAGARRRRSRTSPRSGQADSESDLGVDDLFADLFGSRFGSVAGADQELELVITLEEAYRGGRRRIETEGSTLDVTIPVGVRDGQRIRVAGQGGQGFGGGRRGDLYLRVRVASSPRFRLDGRDVYVELPLSPWEAALGASVAVPTPEGDAKVRVPAGSSTGRRIRLAAHGIPNPSGRAGDLFAEVNVMVPRRLSSEERHLFEELRAVSTFDPRSSS